jgi:type 1 glutamine amidotransferase
MKLITTLLIAGISSLSLTQAETKPLKALLITGGCCHNYKVQKDILKKGIEERANIIVDQMHTDDSTVKPKFPIYGVPEYGAGYDIIIHDECSAGISDDAIVKGVLAPHKAGIPGVNLHCAMHSYRNGNITKPIEVFGTPNSQWFEFLGLQSTSHGKQLPIVVTNDDKNHPITIKLSDWTTINEELYNNIKVFKTAHVLSTGSQGADKAVVTWTNDYNGTRVFNTTLGHNDATVADARYLDLVTRGILWACKKLDDNGEIVTGYGKALQTK